MKAIKDKGPIKKKLYLTPTLPYANAVPHVGTPLSSFRRMLTPDIFERSSGRGMCSLMWEWMSMV